jgi:hypothetical protein
MSPQMQQWISGGGEEARHFATGLVIWMSCVIIAALIAPVLYRAHRRGMERVRRLNERTAPKHARKGSK